MLQHGMCTLDCFDICSFACEVEDGKIMSIKGWQEHPLTKGFICPKGRAHVSRLSDPKRLTTPLLRRGETFEAITITEAIQILVEQLRRTLEKNGTRGIVHYYEAGYSGISKQSDELFFNCLGGATKSEGGLCWSAGIKAQKLDFGNAICHAPEDLLNSELIILWGRNPKVTNIHLVPYLIDAKKKGAKIIVIDPVKSESVDLADTYLQVRPGTDGALALGMIKYLLDNGGINEDRMNREVIGWEGFKKTLEPYNMTYVSEITGLSPSDIEAFASQYGQTKAAAIYLGFGIQRYSGGVNAVRAINALGMAAGHIGQPGGGVNYANRVFSEAYGDLNRWSEQFIINEQTFPTAQMGRYLVENEVDLLWISKGNPVVMMPNAQLVIDGMHQAAFTVVVDHFMTDTAKQADLILPDTMLFEEEDIVYSSMFSSFMGYSEKMIEAPKGIIGEFELFQLLAKELSIGNYPKFDSKDDYFKAQLETVFNTFGFDLETLKTKKYIDGRQMSIPWQQGSFQTPSGRYELYSKIAELAGESPYPTFVYRSPDKVYPYRLLTPHVKQSTSSQHVKDSEEETKLWIGTVTARTHDLVTGDRVKAVSKNGSLILPVVVSETVMEGVVVSHAGNREAYGLINVLCSDEVSEFGAQAAYYDTFIQIEKEREHSCKR